MALGSFTRALHSCSPHGLLQHVFFCGTDGILRRKLLYFCITDFYLFISLFVFLFFLKWAYNISAELGIGIGFAFDMLIFIFLYVCSILH